MNIQTLYRYEREPGKVTVSLKKPNAEFTTLFRIIADENKVLVRPDGLCVLCADVSNTEGWMEIDSTSDEEENQNDS